MGIKGRGLRPAAARPAPRSFPLRQVNNIENHEAGLEIFHALKSEWLTASGSIRQLLEEEEA